jgi:AraC-like DNA-binding protein
MHSAGEPLYIVLATADDLTFLASTRTPLCSQRLDKYVVGYYTIQFMEHGGVDLAYDDRWRRMEGAWFWPAYPGPRLRFHTAEGYDVWFHRHVGFRGPRVQRWIASGLWPVDAQPAPPSRDWGTFFDELIDLSKRADHWGRLRAVNLLENLLLELAEHRAQTSGACSRWLDEVLERLDEDGIFSPDYAHIARGVGMGESTLRRRFKEATGISPHVYVLQVRLARARTLLSETDLALTAVAERLGYDNVYFFARQFKQFAGVSPGVYRRSRQL